VKWKQFHQYQACCHNSTGKAYDLENQISHHLFRYSQRPLRADFLERAHLYNFPITVEITNSHVHHILEKVGTESRLQAAAKAKEMMLL
jgi:hypothetical protein